MIWHYTNQGLSQARTIGAALVALGVLMVVFGAWYFNWNREAVELYANGASPARYREMALPAAFGLMVFISGVTVMFAARRRRRA